MSILTAEQARKALNFSFADDMPERVMDILVPGIDPVIKDATGKDWGILTDTYTSVNPTAILAASALLVVWFADPGMIGQISDGAIGLIGQLRTKYLQELAGVS
jgi:hypothetical protein